jgi:hypothetical protein
MSGNGIAARWIATGIMGIVLMNSAAFAGGPAGAQALQSEVRNLRAQIDRGAVSAEDAIDLFAKSLAEKEVSVADVDAYVKGRLSAREYRAFKADMDSALAGIDPEKVSASELGEVVGHALSRVGSEGLSWGSCATTWTGVGAIIATVVVGIIAIIKAKSDKSIKEDHERDRTYETAEGQRWIGRAENWETRLPSDIASSADSLADAADDVAYYSSRLSNLDPEDDEYSRYENLLRDARSQVNRLQADIRRMNEMLQRYRANPEAAPAEALQLRAQLEATIARINAEELQALAEAPANRRLAGHLGIGAGIGAAAGTYLIIRGVRDGGCE